MTRRWDLSGVNGQRRTGWPLARPAMRRNAPRSRSHDSFAWFATAMRDIGFARPLCTPLPRDHNETLAPRPMVAQTLKFTGLLAAGRHRNHRSPQTANRYRESDTARFAGRYLC